MKFFLDSADVDAVKKAAEIGLVDGLTTNPTLIMKSGRDQKSVIKELAAIVDGPISIEGIAEDFDGMIKEAEEFVTWTPHAVIKVPMTPEGLRAVRALTEKGIKTNVTLVFTAAQALLAAKAGATYVSPFVGRLDDIEEDGMQLIAEIMEIYENYGIETEVIVASVRHLQHVIDSAVIGADIATIPPAVYEKLFSHPLTDKGIAKFKEDHKKSLEAASK